VIADGPAARAGIEAGDRILAVEGTPTSTGAALVDYVKARPGERVVLTLRRDGSERTVPVTIRAEQQDGATIGRIGVELRRVELQRLGPFAALGRAGAETWEMSHLTVTMLWNMVMGRVSVKNISGPINIAAFAGETARVGLRPFLTFLAIVSISLGVLNLLPIPILDGGQMVFQVIEWIKGSPLSERAQALGQQVGIALLLLLMSLAFYNDISSRLLN
jgi:regulator of sigma E protease